MQCAVYFLGVMPNPFEKTPGNVPGPYYVDTSCIDCDLCRANAPDVFARDAETGFSFVHHQPTTAEELALAERAREECPCDCIGNDDVGEADQPLRVTAGAGR